MSLGNNQKSQGPRSGQQGGWVSWCSSWWNSLWQEWSCGLVHCQGGNATDPIWRMLASCQGISSWTPLKPQHSHPNPNPLANQLWCIDFLTPPIPLIIPHRLPAFLESVLPLNNWCSIHARWLKSGLKHCIRFCGIIFSNCCCSSSFEPEIIKMSQSSHKMYSNKILNFQVSTTILNVCTKKSGNLLKAPRMTWFYLSWKGGWVTVLIPILVN